jgi:hypothetical protein
MKNTVTDSVLKVMPGRNGGTLKKGNWGNKGGTGRPPEKLREACRQILEEFGFDAIVDVFKADDSTHADKLSAFDKLGRYGGLLKEEVDHSGLVSPEEAARRIAQHINGRQEQ